MDEMQKNDGPGHGAETGRRLITYIPVNGMAPSSIAFAPAQNSVQQLVTLLAVSNACLRRNLVRLSRKVKQVGHLTYHDELTGLPNRHLLLDRLRQAMRQAARQRKQVLVLLLDLDGFEWINEKLGRPAGDQLLQQVAFRLASNIRSEDTVCRYGGDEFIIMLSEIEGEESTIAIVRKIRAYLAAPYMIQDQIVTVTASIGSAVYKGDEKNCDDLIELADVAMYLAKAHSTPPTISFRSALHN